MNLLGLILVEGRIPRQFLGYNHTQFTLTNFPSDPKLCKSTVRAGNPS